MFVAETRPIREGQLSTEDLQRGMKLQLYHNDKICCPIEVVDTLEGNKWLLAITLFKKPTSPPFPGWTPRGRRRSKADLGLEPYENGMWNASNHCLPL